MSAIPAYAMQTMILPRSVCDDIDKKVRQFLWGGTGQVRKMSLVGWKTVTKPKQQGGLGLRSMRELNCASLCKLGARLLIEPDTPWAKVLGYKYCNGKPSIENIKPKAGESLIWKGINTAKPLLAAGMRRAIGNGKDTLFWYDRWASSEPLIDATIRPITPEIRSWKVADMWDAGRGWKIEAFADTLPAETPEHIISVEVFTDLEAMDCNVWDGTTSQTCTIESAIRLSRGAIIEDESRVWKLIWKIRAPHRFKFLLWLVCHDRIMSNGNRKLRHVTEHADCTICGAITEYTNHIFRFCAEVEGVWEHFGIKVRHDIPLSPLEWVLACLHENANDSHWPTRFCTIVWWIWPWRNMSCFGNTYSIPVDKINFLHGQIQTILTVIDRGVINRVAAALQPVVQQVRWKPPPFGWVSLNTDGAAANNGGGAGGGGAFHNHLGNWLFGFSEFYGRCGATKAEFKAVLRGLRLANANNMSKLVIQTDSKRVVEALSGAIQVFGEEEILADQCRRILALEEWEVRVEHCFRETNKVADRLATLGVKSSLDFRLFYVPPEEVIELVQDDLSGVSWPRTVYC